jgi:hypothetical protein
MNSFNSLLAGGTLVLRSKLKAGTTETNLNAVYLSKDLYFVVIMMEKKK